VSAIDRGGTRAVAAGPGLVPARPAIFWRGRLARVEILAGASALGLLALVMCLAHIRRGGFFYDDWTLLELGRFPGPRGALHELWMIYGQRPVQVLYYAALYQLAGSDAPLRLAIAAAMVVLQATCLFALLRAAGLAARHAIAIACLALTFPFSDSLWLWGVLSLASLALAAWLLGAILALRALRSSGRRALALHAASLSLYLASLLGYELVAVAGALTGLLYVRAVGLRRARVRWIVDVAAIVGALALARVALPSDLATPGLVQSLPGMVSHAGLILGRGMRLIGAAALPLDGVDPAVGGLLLVGVLALAGGLRLRLDAEDPARAELGRWLAIGAAGALVAICGWAVYVPASDHYTPGAFGTINRMNAVAAIGIAILLYSALVLLVSVLARLARVGSATASVALTAAVLALGAGFLVRTAADARAWDEASAAQRQLLSDLHAALPRPPGAATLLIFDAPPAPGGAMPVLDTTLDLTNAIRLSYSSPRLVGVRLLGAADLQCSSRGPLAAGVAGAYGSSYLLDAAARRAVALPDAARCAAQRALVR
jgi:hypothetical protein